MPRVANCQGTNLTVAQLALLKEAVRRGFVLRLANRAPAKHLEDRKLLKAVREIRSTTRDVYGKVTVKLLTEFQPTPAGIALVVAAQNV